MTVYHEAGVQFPSILLLNKVLSMSLRTKPLFTGRWIREVTKAFLDRHRSPGGCTEEINHTHKPGACVCFPSPTSAVYGCDGKPQ